MNLGVSAASLRSKFTQNIALSACLESGLYLPSYLRRVCVSMVSSDWRSRSKSVRVRPATCIHSRKTHCKVMPGPVYGGSTPGGAWWSPRTGREGCAVCQRLQCHRPQHWTRSIVRTRELRESATSIRYRVSFVLCSGTVPIIVLNSPK